MFAEQNLLNLHDRHFIWQGQLKWVMLKAFLHVQYKTK